MHALNRRRFLWLLGGASVGGGAALRSLQFSTQSDGLVRESRTSEALGAHVSLTVLHSRSDVALRALDAAFAELELVEQTLSLYRPDSQISRLNRDGRLEAPHPHLLTVLRKAQEVSARSDGAFDVTVQPLWAVHAAAQKLGRPVDADALAAARKLVDWQALEIDDRRVTLQQPGMAITLNGIAQGFATDRVAAVLREHGVAHALVDAGELNAWGRREDQSPWRVGIQHPREADAFLALAELDGRCLATSGDYATRFDAGSPFGAPRGDHHIVDPATGRSPRQYRSVSVAARTAMEADALSTALFVLPPEKGLPLAFQTPGVELLLVEADGRSIQTPGFPTVRTESA